MRRFTASSECLVNCVPWVSRKIGIHFFLAYFLVTALVLQSNLVVDAAESKTIRVVPNDYSSIQEAINAAENGDIVLVTPGIYYENVIVNKTISLIAENQNAMINGTSGSLGSVVKVIAINASIIGFTIRGGSAGIFLHGRKDLKVSTIVRGNRIMDAEYGVYVYWSNGSLVTENTLVNNTNGVYAYWSSAQVTKNVIENNSNGALATGSRSSTYNKNTFRNNVYGINIGWSQVAHRIYHNNFISNTQNTQVSEGVGHVWDDGFPSGGNYWSGYTGTDLYGGFFQNETGSDGIGDIPHIIDSNNQDNYPLMTPWTPPAEPKTWTVDDDGPADFHTIQEAINAAENGDTIYVYNGTYYEKVILNKTVSLTGENQSITVIDGGGDGTTVYITSDNVTIKGFTIKNGEIGLHIQSSANTTLEKNEVLRNSFDGVKIANSSGIKINNNMLSRNSQHGIFIFQSSHNSITNNTVTSDSRWSVGIFIYSSSSNEICCNEVRGTGDNEGGVELLNSTDNILRDNVVINNNWSGISLRYSSNNAIRGNTIADHKWFGMRITYSHNNHIYQNNLISNTQQVSLDSANATWDYNGLGNYWNNYICHDNNFDGVGDTPYQINENNTDHFPLMGKFYTFTGHKEDNEFKVWVISNSTISDFTYADSQNGQNISLIRFNITGKDDSIGFCRITIPHALLEEPYEITVNALPPIMENEITSNVTHTCLYFTYHHSIKQVVIIPEIFPTTYLAILLLVSLITIMTRKKLFQPK